MKQAIIGILIVIGIIAGATMLSSKEETVLSSASNNVFGNLEAKITLTEYGDFQCPACKSFEPIVAQIKEEFKNEIKFEFKHFPLVQIHPNATAAHRASQAAANQGKYWAMHDLLYENQQSWASSSNVQSIFEQFATGIGLDMTKYLSDVSSSEVLAVINTDVASGKALGLDSTPSFILDGKKIEDLSSISTYDSFKALIQKAIDDKKVAADSTQAQQ